MSLSNEDKMFMGHLVALAMMAITSSNNATLAATAGNRKLSKKFQDAYRDDLQAFSDFLDENYTEP